MFRIIGNILHVASPTNKKALQLLDLEYRGKIGNSYLIIITPIVVAFFVLGPLIFTLTLIFDTMTLEAALWSVALTVLGAGGGFAMAKAGYAIAHDRQTARMRKFAQRGLILQLPQACSDELLPQLRRLECIDFLNYYRPDPYDFGDLTKLKDEFDQGSGSPAFIATRVATAMNGLAGKIYTAMRDQEGSHSDEAAALDELPRPGDFEG